MIDLELKEELRELFDKRVIIPILDWQLRIELKNQLLSQLREQFRWHFKHNLSKNLYE